MTVEKNDQKKGCLCEKAISHSEHCQDSKLAKVPRIPCIYPRKGVDQKAGERQG